MSSFLRCSAAGLMMLAISAAGASAADKLDLRLHFVNSQTRRTTLTLEQVTDCVIRNSNLQTSQTLTVGCTMSVSNVDPAGTATVTVRYDSLAFHCKSGSQQVDYDSSTAGATPPLMASGIAGMVGRSFSVVVTPTGRVTQVTGLQKLFESIMGGLTVPDGPTRVVIEKTLRQQLNEQNVRFNMQNLFAPFPGGPIAPGQTWERKADVNLGFPMSTATTFKLISRAGGLVSIETAGAVSTRPNTTIDLKPFKMDFDLHGDQTGGLQVDEYSGWTRKAELSQSLTGSMTVRSTDALPETVPVTIHTKLTLSTN